MIAHWHEPSLAEQLVMCMKFQCRQRGSQQAEHLTLIIGRGHSRQGQLGHKDRLAAWLGNCDALGPGRFSPALYTVRAHIKALQAIATSVINPLAADCPCCALEAPSISQSAF